MAKGKWAGSPTHAVAQSAVADIKKNIGFLLKKRKSGSVSGFWPSASVFQPSDATTRQIIQGSPSPPGG